MVKITQAEPLCSSHFTAVGTVTKTHAYEHNAAAPQSYTISDFFTKVVVDGCDGREICTLSKANSATTCELGALPTEILLVSGTDPVSISASKTVAAGYEHFICMKCTIGSH